MVNNHMGKIIEILLTMIDEDWTEIRFFYAINDSGSSFIYYLDNGENCFDRKYNRGDENLKNEINMYLEFKSLRNALFEESDEKFYGFELELDSEMKFKVRYYYEELKFLEPSFTVMFWEYVRFNGANSNIELALEIENVRIEDLPF